MKVKHDPTISIIGENYSYMFDPEDYNANIQCTYDLGNHSQLPVFQQCSRCKFLYDRFTPLCTICGYYKNDLKLCNDCFEETSEAKKAIEHIEGTLMREGEKI